MNARTRMKDVVMMINVVKDLLVNGKTGRDNVLKVKYLIVNSQSQMINMSYLKCYV